MKLCTHIRYYQEICREQKALLYLHFLQNNVLSSFFCVHSRIKILKKLREICVTDTLVVNIWPLNFYFEF